MLTTITINGSEGHRFLASLDGFTGRVPPALAAMVDRTSASPEHDEPISIEVEARLADEIAAFVDQLVAGRGVPLLFSAQPGDLVVVVRDVLCELQVGKRESRTWRYVQAGTRGRFVARRGDTGKILLLDGPATPTTVRRSLDRAQVFLSDRSMTRARDRPQREMLGR